MGVKDCLVVQLVNQTNFRRHSAQKITILFEEKPTQILGISYVVVGVGAYLRYHVIHSIECLSYVESLPLVTRQVSPLSLTARHRLFSCC